MPSAENVQQRIASHLPGSQVEVVDTTGTGDHFSARVLAAQFTGLSLIQQHKLVYAAVQDGLDDGSIHALAIKTSPLEETT